jgi:hypothetical protein
VGLGCYLLLPALLFLAVHAHHCRGWQTMEIDLFVRVECFLVHLLDLLHNLIPLFLQDLDAP